MANYDSYGNPLKYYPQVQSQTLVLPPAPTNPPQSPCGPCSGTTKYNSQLDGNCDFTGSRPVMPPSWNPFSQLPTPQSGYTPDTGYLYDQPTPVSPNTQKPVGPSTIPQIIGQFFDKYLNPDTKIPPNQIQTGSRPFGKPCPRDIIPKLPNKTIPPPRPTDVLPRPQPGPCYNPCEDTWNNTGSKRLPQQIMCGSGNMRCQPNPFQPQFVQPHYVPPILQSGKKRDSTTPEDICVPDNSPQGYHYEQQLQPSSYRLPPPPNFGGQGVFNPF